MSLETIEHETGPNPTASIVFLHGLGADGHDFEPFVEELDLRAIGPVRWLLPNAPRRMRTCRSSWGTDAWTG